MSHNSLAILDPQLLRTLVIVAETRSFSQAGQRLGLAQSSVSAQVKRLEELVGHQLISRTTRSVALTDDGVAMVGFGKEVLTIAERAGERFARLPSKTILRLGFCDGMESSAFPSALVELRRIYPNSRITMINGHIDELIRKIDMGQLDLLLGAKPAGESPGEVIMRQPLAWIGQESSLTKDISGPVPLAVRRQPSTLRDMMLQSLDRESRAWVISFEGDSIHSVRAAAFAGIGVTAYPRDVVPQSIPFIANDNLPKLGELEFFQKIAESSRADAARTLAGLIRNWTSEAFKSAI